MEGIFNFEVVKNNFLIALFKDILLRPYPLVFVRSRLLADCQPGHVPMHSLKSWRWKEEPCRAQVPPLRRYQAPAFPSSSSQRP